MNLEQCRYLINIAEKGSINKASEELSISHQALSKMVKKLEKEFGCQIFRRNEQGVFLTTGGDKILAFARLFMDEGQRMRSVLAQIERGSEQKETLKILTTMVPHYSFLPDVVGFLLREYPHLNVEMYHKDRQEIDQALLKNDHESTLAFLTSRTKGEPKSYGSLRQYRLCQDKTFLVTGRKFPLSPKKSVSIDELRGKKFAVYQYDNAFDMPIFQWLEQASIPFEILIKTDNLKVWENILTTSEVIGLSTKLLREYHYFHVDERRLAFYDIEHYPEADIVMLAKNIDDQDLLEEILTRIQQHV